MKMRAITYKVICRKYRKNLNEGVHIRKRRKENHNKFAKHLLELSKEKATLGTL